MSTSVGRKPEILRIVVESALPGTSAEVAAVDRDYVRRIRASDSITAKIDIYAEAIMQMQQRLAPVFIALREAAHTDESCRALWAEIGERRARNMLEFAADLRSTGQMRDDLSDHMVADIIWSMNSTEYWLLLVHQRGWSPETFRDWIAEASRSLLVQDPTRHRTSARPEPAP